MLVLTRRPGQSIRVGAHIEVRVVRIEGDRVVLGIVAPTHIAVVRSELVEQVSGEVREAATTRARLRVMLTPLQTVSPAGADVDQPEPEGPGIA